ncbi:hypothetical protein BDV33DRAFT_171119 [Aspergillus novoparasiticus]|uniref:Uncharacterized protein n=1 Tax=Aspergillus novoparasiticus TaxID=986946 RepID=A0A5N6ETT7_9EURO|nr:hypothetical protein BDV33DRAFT_171119 [Aspergillus novoparasiticus]
MHEYSLCRKLTKSKLDHTPCTRNAATPYYPAASKLSASARSEISTYNNVKATDQTILRGELLLILRLMFTQLRKRRFLKHMVAPVLIFSIVGPQHARIIEAIFDGSNLVLRTTKIFDLRYKNVQGLKDFAEYYLGPPIGDTVKT